MPLRLAKRTKTSLVDSVRCRRFLWLGVAALSACASFTPEHERYIDEAMAMQAAAIEDPLFREVLLELETKGAIVWEGRIRSEVLEEVASFPTPTHWVLDRYSTNGGLPRENLLPWRSPWPWASTTALYTARTNTVELNLWKFNYDAFALLNTFLHEQNHSFGLIHDRSQTRESNHCDAGYLAGDLAEAIARTRDNDTATTTPHRPVCPALCAALQARDMWSACEAQTTRL